MYFFVTGGAGFLGAALSNRLARDGHQVRVIDDLSAGDPARLDERVLFTRGDVADRPKLWTLLQDVDCVYHLAARVLVSESILYPREYNKVNVGGAVSVMEAMRDAGVSRVVLASSGAIYGEQAHQPVQEDQPPNPQSPYAVSKLAAEYYVRTIGALWGIETVILRIFNAYGPGQNLPPSHPPAVPRFMHQALLGGSLVIFGGGGQTRDFVYVDDVVEALAAAATASDVDRRIINVGSGHETSINELVALTAAAAGRKADVLRSPAESGGVSRLCADISVARKLLGYEPRVGLAQGLRLTLERDPRFQR
ncbi:MAG: epimerase [Chloroflexi bacterium]|nr:MAG: epimerase [Anaerolineaceae bacterium 4572_32.2]RLC71608.1 MAG: epimerase [Chloroflexota bacterium]RLC80809.1 MAG: epimerase [Chloroflexota bacterium]HEY73336.1 NAD-dependent epimerase/dehydratase family protein [Thermoflexia bacterium]